MRILEGFKNQEILPIKMFTGCELSHRSGNQLIVQLFEFFNWGWRSRSEGKFHGKSNGHSIEALKRCLDPEMGHKSLIWGQKSPNIKFKLRKKLYQHLGANFYDKSNGDSLDVLKRCLDSKMGHKAKNRSIQNFSMEKVIPPFSRKNWQKIEWK